MIQYGDNLIVEGRCHVVRDQHGMPTGGVIIDGHLVHQLLMDSHGYSMRMTIERLDNQQNAS